MSKIRIPKTLSEAVRLVIKALAPEDRERFRSQPKKDVVILSHFGLGMWIRNRFRLWEPGNRLVRSLFWSHLVFDADGASNAILETLHDALNDKPLPQTHIRVIKRRGTKKLLFNP